MLGAAASSTEADRSGSVAAPGMDEAKRRRVTPQSKMQNLFGSTLGFRREIITSDSGCINCLSDGHKTKDCPNEGAKEWKDMLIGVCDGLETRNTTIDTEMVIDLEKEDPPEPKSGIISFHNEPKPLHEIVGEGEIKSTHVGGKDPFKMGFRKQEMLYNEIIKHMKETQYLPQMGHESSVDQRGMEKYLNWTTQVRYGKVVPIGAEMAVFADPAWGDCTFDGEALSKNYNHNALQNYTTRWNKVLRHDIGHSGRSARCDELGWASVEEFIRNDHAWPKEDRKAYNIFTRQYDDEVLEDRRNV